MLIKRVLAISLLLLWGLGNVEGAVSESPQTLVQDTSERMLEALRKNQETLKQHPSQIYDLVHKIVLPHFDFELMSRWVLGKYWRQATPEQRQRFTEEFRNLLVRTYANALLEYSNEKVKVLPMPRMPQDIKDVTVRTEIVPKNGAPIPIDYSMHLRDEAWKVYDVTIDGVSLVTNYRGTFADQIRREGMDAVIRDLSERNQQDKV